MEINTIAVCAYRIWAIKVYKSLVSLFPEIEFLLIENEEEFEDLYNNKKLPHLIFCIGWSAIIRNNSVNENYIIGVHPSDLPDYAGGSPLQHQILDGIIKTKISLFQVTEEVDGGPIIAKLPLDLSGHMKDIFERLFISSTILFSDFINNYPLNIKTFEQNNKFKKYKRLKPKDSELDKEKLLNMTALDLYNFIRSKEDPYPNAFLKDNTGKITFKKCDFKFNNE